MSTPTNTRTPLSYHAGELAPAESGGTGTAVPPGLALASTASAVILFAVVAGLLAHQGMDIILATVIGESLLVLVPIAWLMVARNAGGRVSFTDALGLRRPAGVFLAAALLLGLSQWIWNLALVALVTPIVGTRDAGVDQLENLIKLPSLPLLLLAIAVVPAVAEEILFRGVLARGLATKWVPWVAVLVPGVAFSAFHLSLVRMLPTLTLGLVYGYMALRSRSVVPSMLAHLVNNSCALLVGRLTLPMPSLAEHPVVATVGAVSMSLVGVGLVVRGPR